MSASMNAAWRTISQFRRGRRIASSGVSLNSAAVRADDGIVRNERRRERLLSINQLRLFVQQRVDVLVGNHLHHDGSEPAVHQELQPFEAIARVKKIRE